MLALILILTALTVGLFAYALLQVRTGRGAVIGRLDQLQTADQSQDRVARRRRQMKSARLMGVLQALGQQVGSGRKDATEVRLFLIQAGFSDPRAVSIYWASRVSLAVGLSAFAVLGLPLLGFSSSRMFIGLLWLGGLGWIGPTFYVRGRLTLVNLEMRAGTPRDEALKNLAERTGLPDIRALVNMMIQTDRFGTSVADALRVHSETMRTKRRQRAEEAAAKTTIKLVFPLVLLVFPAMFLVVIGPSALAIYRTFSKL
jgi:Flp pilus assembly protein TadB